MTTDADIDAGTQPGQTDPDIAGATVEVASETSIDDAINAAFDTHDTEEARADRARDELGRFTAAEQAAAREAAAKDIAAPDQQQQAPVADVAAPAAWGKAREVLFRSLPPEAQAYINERERQVSEGFKRFEGVAEYADLAARNGGTLRSVLDTVKQIEDAVAADPVKGFSLIMSRAGYDPASVARAFLGDGTAQPQQPAAIPPQIEATIRSLQGEVQSLKVAPIQREIDAFVSDPANKHFDRVAGMMAALIQSDATINLKDAYERACYADPQVRAELLQEQQKAAAADQASKLAKASQAAQRASRGLSGSTSSAAPLNGKPRIMSVEESIEAAFAAHA